MSKNLCVPGPCGPTTVATPPAWGPWSAVDMVWPDQSNHHGTLFGGAALAMLDRLAFIRGSQVLRGTVVTAAVSRLDFAAPAPAGHLVDCTAPVSYTHLDVYKRQTNSW